MVGKKDELHFRVEMKAIQLSMKVTFRDGCNWMDIYLILGSVTGPGLHSEGGGCNEKRRVATKLLLKCFTPLIRSKIVVNMKATPGL